MEKGDYYFNNYLLDTGGVNLNALALESHGRTVLQAAVEKGDNNLINASSALASISMVFSESVEGKAHLLFAAEQGYFELLFLLLNAGANMNYSAASLSGAMTLECGSEKCRNKSIHHLLDVAVDEDDPIALLSTVLRRNLS